jgi:uncharacterized membrane protein (GlpM family)
MRFALRLVLSICVIIFCTQIGKRAPSLAGLIAVMPLTGLIVLVWLYSDNPGDFGLMADYTKAVLWGLVPSVLFFLTAFVCFRRHLALWAVLCASFVVWLIGAAVHQWLFNK